MVIAIIGENCTGKSTLANRLNNLIPAEIISGKDYLRMAKSESEAAILFKKKLSESLSGGNVIYVISEKDQLYLLPDGALKILVTANLETIKERFKKRMHGNLPKPIEQMLEKKYGMFDSYDYDIRYDSDRDDMNTVCESVRQLIP